MAAQGDAYGFKTDIHNCTPKTPTKSPCPRRKSGFQQYLLQEQNSLSSKYPFLTQSQIKSKAAQNWSKLSENNKDDYRPITIRSVVNDMNTDIIWHL
jgi:hypothetical protein